MKSILPFVIIFLVFSNFIIGQDQKEYLFFSNSPIDIDGLRFPQNELIHSNNIELISLGDNSIRLLQDISQSCTDCKVRTVIGDGDIEHQINPSLKSYKFKKKTICPDPIVKEMDENHVMIILNSNWFLDRNYKFNAQNYDCDFFNEIHILEELEDILEDYRNWNKIIVAHHGLTSISELAGRGLRHKNLIPFYGQLYVAFRKNIGFHQDVTSHEYQKYIALLGKVISKFDNVCFISGHDHLNHVIKDRLGTHININTSDQHYSYQKSDETVFVAKEANFLKLSKSKGEWIFNLVSESGEQQLTTVFQSIGQQEEIGEKDESLPSDVNSTSLSTSGKVKASEKYDANGLTRFFMGDGYRAAWSEPVTAPFLDITQYDGGLTPYAIGGGLQTMSVKFKSQNGKKYAFRVLDKKPEKSLSDIARESVYRVIVQELITTMHPYGPLVANSLLDATDIIHIKPELYILQDHPELDHEYKPFVGKIGTLEEKPAGKNKTGEGFYGAEKVVSSFDMFISLRKSHKNKVDPLAYAKARLMDMYLGDWDRHEDNWKWAMYKKGDQKIYKPIPKDRDHVFSKWTGLIPNVADIAISNAENFGEQFGNLRHLNFKARFLDRELSSEVNLKIWLEAADYLQQALTDEVIDNAISQLPDEVESFNAEELARKLKRRRADLKRAITEYYAELNASVYITGTNKSDIFEIERMEDGHVKVLIFDRDKNKEKGDLFYERVLNPDIVDKVYCFGLDGEDQFFARGEVEQSIKIRIIGGSDADYIKDASSVKGKSKYTQVYDSSDEDSVEKSAETFIKRPSRPAQYDPYSFDYNWLIPNVLIRRSSGNGIGFGGGFTYLIRGFNKPGFAKKWTFGGVYYPSLKAYRLDAGLSFRHFIGFADLNFRSQYSSLYDRYPFFYGIGNDTKVDRKLRRDVNRIDYDYFDFEAGLSTTFARKSTWSGSIVYENHDVDNRDDVIVLDPSINGYGSAYYIGLKSSVELDFTDNAVYPEDGAQFELTLEGRKRIDGGLSSNLNSRFSYFKTINLGIKTTFIGSLHYKQANGDPAFYHLSRLGSQSQFRGYTRNRFIDKYAFLYNSELRISLGSIKTPLVRFVVGVFGFYDGGRVWNDSSEFYVGEWNNSFGGGFFFAPGTKDYTLSYLIGWPEDDFVYSKLQLGFDF